MPDIDLSSAFPLVLIVTGLLAAAGVAVLFYRRTVPPVSLGWRIFLGTLRTGVLFLLFFLFAEPMLSLLHRSRIPPAVVVLADNSRSMMLASDHVSETFDAVASSSELRMVGDDAAIHWYRFDHRLTGMDDWSADSLTFAGDRTDLAEVFEALRSNPPAENLRAVILLSDGNSTSPAHPVYAAEALGAAVFTVGIGDSTERKDVLISGVAHNSVAYAGTRLPVQVTVRSSGYENERVQVSLRLNGRETDRDVLQLGAGSAEHRTTLAMTPDSAGTVRGDVILSRLDGEATYENNRSVFFTTVLSGKRTVLLVAGAPDPDASFIRRSLESDSNLTVIARIERRGGTFLEGDLSADLIRRSDVVFLIGFPGPFTTEPSVQLLSSAEFRDRPVFVMLGRRTNPSLLNRLSFSRLVTVRDFLSAERQVFLTISPELRQHPILKLDNPSLLSTLPPIFQPQGQYTLSADVQVLATSRLPGQALNEPLLATRSVAGQRSILLLGYGLWRWKMLPPMGGRSDSPFDIFLQNSVQWLTAIDDERPFRVSAARESFSALEPIVFRAEVYDQSMQPVSGASISMTISGEGRTYGMEFSSLDNGQYEAAGDVLPPGTYTYAASAQAGGITLGSDRGSFTVGGLQAEFLETRLNKDLLWNLAYRTGGTYYENNDLQGLAQRIKSLPGFQTEERAEGAQIELTHSGWVLGLIILLLSIEWFFRKRLGLL